jgi:hypothetical protein
VCSIVVPSGVTGSGTARVLVVGGFDQNVLASCEWYDPATDTWSLGPPLNVARHSTSLCVLDRSVLAIGWVGDTAHPSIEGNHRNGCHMRSPSSRLFVCSLDG